MAGGSDSEVDLVRGHQPGDVIVDGTGWADHPWLRRLIVASNCGSCAAIVPFDLSPHARAALAQLVLQHRASADGEWVDAVRSDAALRPVTEGDAVTPLIAWFLPAGGSAADRRALIPHGWLPPAG